MTSTKYQVLARRYRPQRFCEVVGQESAVTTLKNALRFDKAAHAYLFCGSRGVGKTTLARLFAKALNCLEKGPDMEPCNRCSSCLEIGQGQSLDVIEIDGASNRGIDDIRQINETALYSPSSGRYKIYIIDEVHMLTKEAFNALLKTLEEPPEKAKFFFATTEPHKVLPTIVSRCQRFDLGRIQLSQIIGKLEEIAADLGRSAEPEALHLIATFSDGSLRDAESLFDQILCFAEGPITAAVIRTSLGLISQEHFFALDQAFSEAKAAFAFELVDTLFTSGKDLAHFYEQLIEHVRNLSCARLLGEKGLSLSPDLAARYLQASRLYASSQCLYLLEYLLRSESQLQKSACQRVALEAILLHYIQSKHRIPMEVLVRRLTEMETALQSAALPMPIAGQEISRNNLKIPELVQDAPQKVCTERATIAPSQDASENKNSEVKPTQAKTDSLDCSIPKPIATPTSAVPPISVEKPTNLNSIPELPSPPVSPTTPIEHSISAPEPVQPPKPETPLPISLKPVPFNPYKPEQEAKSLPSPQKIESTTLPIEPKTPKIATATPEPLPSVQATPNEPTPTEKQARYDTLMRFATVELEGTLKLGE